MTRSFVAFVLVVLLGGVGSAPAADADLAGTWRLHVMIQGQRPTLWLIQFQKKLGKWEGAILASMQKLPRGKIENVRVEGELVQFSIKLGETAWTFDGKLGPGAVKKVLGTLDMAGEQMPFAQLEPSKLKTFDSFELTKEMFEHPAGDLELFQMVESLLGEAGERKAKPEEVRSWAEKALKTAEPYGSRWQRDMALLVADSLAGQADYAQVALEYARRAERLLEPEASPETQARALHLLAQALGKTNRTAEAQEALKRAEKFEARAYQEYAKTVFSFRPTLFSGRKTPNNRAVLVELFTGAQCPPCVAADMAFDALQKSYKSSDVVLLQYHLHVPAPDPLTSPDSEARANYYNQEVGGTPVILFNGKAGDPPGGRAEDAEERYKEFRSALNPLLELAGKVELKASASRKDDVIEIAAEYAQKDVSARRLRLRLVLVEEVVQYAGRNGLRYHHQVVRAMPGSANGIAVTDKAGKHTETVDLGALRRQLSRYLDDQEFSRDKRPLNLRRLRIVAFVQSDESKEVLQAVQVNVP